MFGFLRVRHLSLLALGVGALQCRDFDRYRADEARDTDRDRSTAGAPSSGGMGGDPGNEPTGGHSGRDAAGGSTGGNDATIPATGGTAGVAGAAGGPQGEPIELCGKTGIPFYEVLDDFEDGDLVVADVSGRDGSWLVKGNQGDPPPVLAVEQEAEVENQALRLQYHGDAALEVYLRETQGFHDLSRFRAVQFRMRADEFGSNDLIFKMLTQTQTTDYYAGGHTVLPYWETVTFCFTHEDPDPHDKYQLKQQGWGGIAEELRLELTRGLLFLTANAAVVDLWLDDVTFVGLR